MKRAINWVLWLLDQITQLVYTILWILIRRNWEWFIDYFFYCTILKKVTKTRKTVHLNEGILVRIQDVINLVRKLKRSGIEILRLTLFLSVKYCESSRKNW